MNANKTDLQVKPKTGTVWPDHPGYMPAHIHGLNYTSLPTGSESELKSTRRAACMLKMSWHIDLTAPMHWA